MTEPHLDALDRRRCDLIAELAAVEAAIASAGAEVTIGQAAWSLGLSYEATRLKALKLERIGLARKIRPGGWRISAAALETNQPNRRGGRHG